MSAATPTPADPPAIELSDQERRALDEIADALARDDPRLAAELGSRTRPVRHARSTPLIAAALLALGGVGVVLSVLAPSGPGLLYSLLALVVGGMGLGSVLLRG